MMAIATLNDTAIQGLDEQRDMVEVSAGVTNDAHIWNIVHCETYPFLSWQSVGQPDWGVRDRCNIAGIAERLPPRNGSG